MKLTGKCKEDFLDYYWENYIKSIGIVGVKLEAEEFFDSLYPIFKNALIIEFFDSVGIYIVTGLDTAFSNKFEYGIDFIKKETIFFDERFNSRTEATNAAIEKANELYNKSL